MKTKLLIIVCILFMISSCAFFANPWSPCRKPNKTTYTYYNSNFIFDTLSSLDIKKIYLYSEFRPKSDKYIHFIFSFFNNGIVKQCVVFDGGQIKRNFFKPNYIGRTGYYIIRGDSIKFTTNVCYNREFEKSYKGVIKGDTLFLKRINVGSGYKHNKKYNYILIAKSVLEVKRMLLSGEQKD